MNDKLLLNCRRLFLRGLTVQVSIGVHDFEQHAPQRIIISTHVLDHVRRFERVLWLDKGRVRADACGSRCQPARAAGRAVARTAASGAPHRLSGGQGLGGHVHHHGPPLGYAGDLPGQREHGGPRHLSSFHRAHLRRHRAAVEQPG